jgi:choline dehydrogenase-like flavoprotein
VTPVIPRALTGADPARLPADATDVLVVGSGVAGLSLALELAGRCRVLLVTKGTLANAATRYAQGGIAAVLGPPDSPADHLADTLAAGADCATRPPSGSWSTKPLTRSSGWSRRVSGWMSASRPTRPM